MVGFPLSEEEKMRRRGPTRECKRDELDGAIADLMIARLIALDLIVDRNSHEKAREDLLEILDQDANPNMLNVIFSDNLLLYHDVSVDPKYQIFVKREDRLRKAVGKVIHFAYDGEIGHNDLAKKKVGCVNVILGIVNSYDFSDRMRTIDVIKRNPVNRKKTYYGFRRRIP